MPVKPDATRIVHREANTSPPAQPIRGTGDLLDLDDTLDASEPSELFGHERTLQAPLFLNGDVLPIATPASSGPRVGTLGRHPEGRRAVAISTASRAKVGLRRLGHDGTYALARQAVAHENNTPVIGPRDTTTTGGDTACFEFHEGVAASHFTALAALSPRLSGHLPPVDCA